MNPLRFHNKSDNKLLTVLHSLLTEDSRYFTWVPESPWQCLLVLRVHKSLKGFPSMYEHRDRIILMTNVGFMLSNNCGEVVLSTHVVCFVLCVPTYSVLTCMEVVSNSLLCLPALPPVTPGCGQCVVTRRYLNCTLSSFFAPEHCLQFPLSWAPTWPKPPEMPVGLLGIVQIICSLPNQTTQGTKIHPSTRAGIVN